MAVSNAAHGGPASGKPAGDSHRDLIPREFVRTIAIWSIVPTYAIAGAFLGYLADQWLGIFPAMTAIGLLLALVLSVRDVNRLKDSI